MNIISTLELRRIRSAYTLTEILVASALFGLVVIGTVYSHVVGMKMFNVNATKLSASASARSALNSVRDDIRQAKIIYVGNGNASAFTNAPNGKAQEGNAIQIYPTTSTNNYIRYYVNPVTRQLERKVSSSATVKPVAFYLTNSIVFRAEDYDGKALTNNQNNRLVRMILEHYQWEFPVARAGVGGHYDYYRLQTRITRRAIE